MLYQNIRLFLNQIRNQILTISKSLSSWEMAQNCVTCSYQALIRFISTWFINIWCACIPKEIGKVIMVVHCAVLSWIKLKVVLWMLHVSCLVIWMFDGFSAWIWENVENCTISLWGLTLKRHPKRRTTIMTLMWVLGITIGHTYKWRLYNSVFCFAWLWIILDGLYL